MELKEVQISEIKNLNLIYVFTTDSIFKKGSNKYVGAKIVYEKNKIFALDYKDKHFQTLVKRVLERYNKEKGKRKIILLGDLTKRLINDSSFDVLQQVQKKGIQTVGLPSFNTSDKEYKKEMPYLKEAIEMILTVYKNYEVLSVDEIDGYNKKYIVNYSIGPVNKKMPIILSRRDDGVIDFRLTKIDNISMPISGTLVNNGGRVDITWQSSNNELNGYLLYDAQNGIVERKATSNGETIIYDENKDTLLEEDVSLIKFYFDLCDLQIPKHVLKINETAFLLSDEENLNDSDDEILYSNAGAQINISKDEIIIKYRLKNCFSKYNNQINTVLDQETEEITFKKIDIESRKCILVETKTNTNNYEPSYSYRVFEVSEDVDLNKPFSYEKTYYVDKELKTLENAKQYVRDKKGGSE